MAVVSAAVTVLVQVGAEDKPADLPPARQAWTRARGPVDHERAWWMLAVQWHPEELSEIDGPSRAIFDWIVDEARRFQEQGRQGKHEGAVARISSVVEPEDDIDLTKVSENTPIIKISYAIIREAIRQSATEIHLEPVSKGIVVSYAIEETLRETMTVPKHIQSELFAQFRRMAGLDPGDRTVAQDGVIPIKLDGGDYRLDLKYLPSPVGESVFIKIETA